MTSHLLDAPLLRLTLKPTAENGLKVQSQIQVNRLLSLPITTVGPAIGRLTDREIIELNRLLAVVIGLA
jgi:mRNA interferase MazF